MEAEEEEEEIASSSTTMLDPWSLFLYGMKAPMTREKHRGMVAKFFDFIGLAEEDCCDRVCTAMINRWWPFS